jgi:hypothetical protein
MEQERAAKAAEAAAAAERGETPPAEACEDCGCALADGYCPSCDEGYGDE